MSDEKPNRSKRMQNEVSKLESLIGQLEQPKQEAAIQFGALPPLCPRCQDLEKKRVKILDKSLNDTQKINQELEIDLRTKINQELEIDLRTAESSQRKQQNVSRAKIQITIW